MDDVYVETAVSRCEMALLEPGLGVSTQHYSVSVHETTYTRPPTQYPVVVDIASTIHWHERHIQGYCQRAVRCRGPNDGVRSNHYTLLMVCLFVCLLKGDDRMFLCSVWIHTTTRRESVMWASPVCESMNESITSDTRAFDNPVIDIRLSNFQFKQIHVCRFVNSNC